MTAMDAVGLFLAKYNRLAEIYKNPTYLDLLDIAAILRLFLCDEKCLVHTVNRKKVKLTFRVGVLRDPPGLPPATIHMLGDAIDPDIGPPWRSAVELNADGFLRRIVHKFSGEPYSVKDAIKFAANVAGGVHFDPKPKEDDVKNKVLKAYAEHMTIGNLPLGIRELRAIAIVTVRALEPLAVSLRADYEAAQASHQEMLRARQRPA
jgi:hypothetical protein